ncbi:hypothetical protein [Arthrobacter sp. USHLN218]|uniref:hypothetical protein n=1 Tax=Arthrobacter sp. USHLN218 TaxID=3081232 RepID=UPI00301A68ED
MTVNDWQEILDQWVQIRKDGRVVRTGYVDAVTDRADILWLRGHGAQQRQLFEKTEGYLVEALPHL